MALTPLSTEGGGSARWRCPPVRFLAGAAAAVLEESLAVSLPLPPCFGAPGRARGRGDGRGVWSRALRGRGLWNRSGIFALRFARPPSGAIAGAGGGRREGRRGGHPSIPDLLSDEPNASGGASSRVGRRWLTADATVSAKMFDDVARARASLRRRGLCARAGVRQWHGASHFKAEASRDSRVQKHACEGLGVSNSRNHGLFALDPESPTCAMMHTPGATTALFPRRKSWTGTCGRDGRNSRLRRTDEGAERSSRDLSPPRVLSALDAPFALSPRRDLRVPLGRYAILTRRPWRPKACPLPGTTSTTRWRS